MSAVKILFFSMLLAVGNTMNGYGSEHKTKQLVASAKNSIVKIYSSLDDRKSISGTGFLVEGNKVVTNYHIVRGSREIQLIHVKSKTRVDSSEVISVTVDALHDIAILEIKDVEKFGDFEPLKLANKPVEITDEIIIVSNPEDRLNFVSFGRVSDVECISQLIVGKCPGNEEGFADYSVFVMQHLFGRGSSGGPIINHKTGEVVGVATGVTGDSFFQNFALPIRHVRKNIESINVSNIHDVSQLEALAKSDGLNWYYDKVEKLYSLAERTNRIQVSGIVSNRSGEGIFDVDVRLFNNVSDRKKSLSFLTSTDEYGFFLFDISAPGDMEWELSLNKKNLESANVKLGSVKDVVVKKNLRMYLKRELRKEAVWFYVEPLTVNLERKGALVNIVGRVASYDGRIKQKNIEWKILNLQKSCGDDKKIPGWICFNKTSGFIHSYVGDEVELKYEHAKNIDTGDGFDKKALIKFKATVDKKDRYATAHVYADYSDMINIHGFLYTVDGGVPSQEQLSVQVYTLLEPEEDEYIIEQAQVDMEVGHFEFRVRNDFKGDKLKLKLISKVFEISRQEQVVFDPRKKNSLMVELKSK